MSENDEDKNKESHNSGALLKYHDESADPLWGHQACDAWLPLPRGTANAQMRYPGLIFGATCTVFDTQSF